MNSAESNLFCATQIARTLGEKRQAGLFAVSRVSERETASAEAAPLAHGATTTGAHTAAQIAAALGVTPQAVRKALLDTPAAGVRIVAGNESAVWSAATLPESLRKRLAEKASQGGYRDIESMLSAPGKLWEPPLPLQQIADPDIDSARKLRDALRPWLLQRNDLSVSSAEMEAKGVADYARVSGI